jgi:DNA-binding response OmpR family regulator
MANIVVIEDDPDMRGLMARKLQTVGHQVAVADTGERGLTLVQQVRPELILLDVQLPDFTGLELCRRLRADPAARDTLIMMVSASAADNEVDDGLSAGADDYVTKPFAPSKLVARIEALLAGREGAAD